MTIKQCLLSSVVAFTCVIGTSAIAGPIENYSAVTSSRLENPEPSNWMLYRRTYDGQGYSPLDQINTTNVKNLVPVWTFSTGVVEGHEAPPIVNNGVMPAPKLRRRHRSGFIECFDRGLKPAQKTAVHG